MDNPAHWYTGQPGVAGGDWGKTNPGGGAAGRNSVWYTLSSYPKWRRHSSYLLNYIMAYYPILPSPTYDECDYATWEGGFTSDECNRIIELGEYLMQ
ncbi:MAG: hypothetical protein CM15mV2_0470 [uncultured marine virus]|nr:MAG: hypothetical protein CM15mV2_0470 [uncultured marine virus]